MNLNLPGNIVSINDVKERKMKAYCKSCDGTEVKEVESKLKGEYAISTRKLLFIIFIGLWVIDCLIAAWIIFHTVCG